MESIDLKSYQFLCSVRRTDSNLLASTYSTTPSHWDCIYKSFATLLFEPVHNRRSKRNNGKLFNASQLEPINARLASSCRIKEAEIDAMI
jgi:hypothetical protein